MEWNKFPTDMKWQGWSWNNPELSLLWSPSPVRVMVLNHPEASWVPFDPKTYLPLLDRFTIHPAITPQLQDPK